MPNSVAWIESLGWMLIHSVWLIALIVGISSLVLVSLRRRSANSRYVVGCVGLSASLVTLPALFVWVVAGQSNSTVTIHGEAGQGHLDISARLAAENVVDATVAIQPVPIGSHSQDQSSQSDLPRPEPVPIPVAMQPVDAPHFALPSVWQQFVVQLQPHLSKLVLGWLIGVILLSFRPLIGWREARRLRTVGLSPASEPLKRLLGDLAERLGSKLAIDVFQSSLVQIPCVVGAWRPVILLPVSAITGLSPDQLEAVLAHELAHVRRHDFLVNILQTVVETLLFYHPAIWWLSRRVRQEREHCCDDLAISLCGDVAVYAKMLVSIERLRAHVPRSSVAAGGGSLVERIRRLVPTSQQEPSSAWLSIVLVTALVVFAGSWRWSVGQTEWIATNDSPQMKPVVNPEEQSLFTAKDTASPTRVEDSAITSGSRNSWPQWGGSSYRNHVAPGPLPIDEIMKSTKVFAWEAKLGTQTYSSPVIADGKVLIGTNNGTGLDPRHPSTRDLSCLVCFDQRSGQLLWQYVSEKLPPAQENDWPMIGLCATACVEADRVYIVTNRCEVVCLDTNGFRDGQNDGPVVDEGVLTEIDADVIWKFDMFNTLGVRPLYQSVSSITIVDGVLLLNTSNGPDKSHRKVPAPQAPNFLALDAKTGNVVWQDNSAGESIIVGGTTCSSSGASPAVATIGGVKQAIFPGREGWAYGFDFADLKRGQTTLLWQFDCNPKTSVYFLGGKSRRNTIMSTPVIADDHVFVATGRNVEDGEGMANLWCIDPTRRGDISTELVFNKLFEDGATPIPRKLNPACDIKAGDFVRPNPNCGAVWDYESFDRNGNRKIEFNEAFHRTLGTPAIYEGLLFVADVSGLLHCVDSKTGEVQWTYDLLSSVWGSCLIADGHVLIGDEDGELAVFKAARTCQPLHEGNAASFASPIYGTPALVGGMLFIPTQTAMFVIQKPQPAKQGAGVQPGDDASKGLENSDDAKNDSDTGIDNARISPKSSLKVNDGRSLEPIQGEVVDAVTGQPIKGATVRFRFRKIPREPREMPEPIAELVFRNAGRFTFELPEAVKGRADIVAERTAEHPDYQSLGFSGEHLVNLLLEEPSSRRDFIHKIEMSPGTAVMGRVLDLDGTPAKRIPIFSGRNREGWQNGCEHRTTTDADGRFRLVVPQDRGPGRIYLVPNHAAAVSRAITTNFGEQEVFQLRPGTRLHGHVFDSQGKGIPNVVVRANAGERIPWRFSITDARGEYSLPPCAYGEYVVELVDQGRLPDTGRIGDALPDVYVSQTVSLPKTAPAMQALDFRPVESVRVTAHCRNGDGTPAVDSQLFLHGEINRRSWSAKLHDVAGVPGKYEIRVPRGLEGPRIFGSGGFFASYEYAAGQLYFLRVTRRSASSATSTTKSPVTLDDDDDSWQVQRLKAASVTIRPLLNGQPYQSGRGAPWPNFVNEREAQDVGAGSATASGLATGEGGRFQISVHPNIDLCVTIEGPGIRTCVEKFRLNEGEQRTIEINLEPAEVGLESHQARATNVQKAMPEIVTANPDREESLEQLIKRAIQSMERRRLTLGLHSPWQVMQWFKAFGRESVAKKSADSGELTAIWDWISSGPESHLSHEPVWLIREGVAQAHPFTRSFDVERFVGQFVAWMGAAGVPIDAQLVAFDEDHIADKITVRRLVNDLRRIEIGRDQDPQWLLWALVQYSEPEQIWNVKQPKSQFISTLIQKQVESIDTYTVHNSAVGLMALAIAHSKFASLNKNDQATATELFARVSKKLDADVQQARISQWPDGWMESRAKLLDRRDQNTRLQRGGLELAWLSWAIPQERLAQEEWLHRAARSLAEELVEAGKEKHLTVDGMCDAVFGLKQFQLRMGMPAAQAVEPASKKLPLGNAVDGLPVPVEGKDPRTTENDKSNSKTDPGNPQTSPKAYRGVPNPAQIQLEGRILDARDKPIRNAMVCVPIIAVEDPKYRDVRVAQTDDEGQYRIDVPLDWSRRTEIRHEFWAAAGGYQLDVGMLPFLNSQGNNWTAELLTLKLADAGDVTMRIVAPDATRPENGTPQAEVLVAPEQYVMKEVKQGTGSMYLIGMPPRELWSIIATRTDANGAVNLPCLAQHRVGRIRIESAKYGVQSLGVRAERGGEWLATRQTEPVGRLNGRVVSADGATIEGIKIRVSFKSKGDNLIGDCSVQKHTALTDRDGRFSIPLTEGTASLWVDLPPGASHFLRHQRSIDIRQNETVSIELQMEKPVPITGKVISKTGRETLSGVPVLIRSASGSGYDGVHTDPDGRFSSRALAGAISVSMRVDLTKPADWDIAPDAFASVVVPLQSEAFQIPAIEVVRIIRVKGRLIDQHGNPVGEVAVTPKPRKEGDQVTFGRTKTNGEFEFFHLETVEIDHYAVVTSDSADGFTSTSKTETAKIESEIPLVLRIDRPSATVEGSK